MLECYFYSKAAEDEFADFGQEIPIFKDITHVCIDGDGAVWVAYEKPILLNPKATGVHIEWMAENSSVHYVGYIDSWVCDFNMDVADCIWSISGVMNYKGKEKVIGTKSRN
jgi:hypothetical protein